LLILAVSLVTMAWGLQCGNSSDESVPAPQPGAVAGASDAGAGAAGGSDAGAAGGAGGAQDAGDEESLFDQHLSDAPFGDSGKSPEACYECLVDQCHDELEACNLNDECRTELICMAQVCLSSPDEATLLSCVLDHCGGLILKSSTPEGALLKQAVLCARASCGPPCP
jgi:hypothetical protein